MTSVVLWAYSVGHFANDLCASMWFIYLSFFLINVVGLDPTVAGLCLLSGQIADGITTPIVGYFSDKLSCPCGKRNGWYYFGTVLVIPSFLFIFLGFQFPGNPSAENAWYLVWPAIFNVGWASVQIAHLSIVNSLSYSQRMRDKMAVNRNGFTYAANIFVLSLALILFATVNSQITQFRVLGVTCVAMGALTSMYYICVVREKHLSQLAIEREAQYKQYLGNVPTKKETTEKKGKSAGDWLCEAQFYIFGLVYMFARISLNTTATILPLYLSETLGFKNASSEGTNINLAGVPLSSYIASLAWSAFAQNAVTQHFRNRLIPMVIAIAVTAVGSIPMAFLNSA